ncbi:tRNA delta(2)-isopentenylpyrophosphate transferase [Streptococcus pyogenes]|uniref:cystathionine beta-lyase n=1 Tax=Streptococcus pyogenes TaxID=1314 RepID=UPI000DA4037D|nr:cystathionine beta-lyase [Streptococcus pyogenes]SQF21264.1 cystathionine beta-lyase [Streptococcus pyogenes]VHF46642.1 tRNA delta(2)-isopentenylpyrophosphate transferase [Streptococcus pyogenes]HEP1413471.1 cystathionine beta-lyase [Streptococcus pyogenes]
MNNYIDLAKTYGGFTSLDTNYLNHLLVSLTDQQKLAFITPPPSVINAYFAEIYQKQSPQAATDYYFNLSKALGLFTDQPSFEEEKPFVRLNLSGKAYGFAYQNDQEVALVFSEKAEPKKPELFFELTQIFPQYMVYEDKGQLKMQAKQFEQGECEDITPDDTLLSKIYRLANGITMLKGFNVEELWALSQTFSGQKYYDFAQREFMIYITQ